VAKSSDAPHRLRVVGVVASVVLLVTTAVLVSEGGLGGGHAETTDTSPHLVSAAGLRELEDTLGHSVYWAGRRPPTRIELTQRAEGAVYLHYLPPRVEPGDPDQGFLTVGTYPVSDPVATLERAAASSGTEVEPGPGDGVIFRNTSTPGSVYLAYPDSDLQIEAFDPVPGRSLHLIRSGAIAPVGG